MQCTFDRRDGKLVLHVQGRLDAVTAAEFDQQRDASLEPDDTEAILDLSELEFISSAGLRCVLALQKKLKARGGQLILCGLKSVVADVFAISGLSFVLPIYNTADEAVAAHEPSAEIH
jgi:anti-anti-sigma factor